MRWFLAFWPITTKSSHFDIFWGSYWAVPFWVQQIFKNLFLCCSMNLFIRDFRKNLIINKNGDVWSLLYPEMPSGTIPISMPKLLRWRILYRSSPCIVKHYSLNYLCNSCKHCLIKAQLKIIFCCNNIIKFQHLHWLTTTLIQKMLILYFWWSKRITKYYDDVLWTR